jgi:hypothetical protein
MIPRLKLSVSSEKNIYNSPDAVVDGSSGVIDTDSFKVQSTYFEIALPFILNNTSAGQPFIEPSIANKFGTTHLGLRFGFLF